MQIKVDDIRQWLRSLKGRILMEQIRSFPPTGLINQAEAEEKICLARRGSKGMGYKNWLSIGGELYNLIIFTVLAKFKNSSNSI